MSPSLVNSSVIFVDDNKLSSPLTANSFPFSCTFLCHTYGQYYLHFKEIFNSLIVKRLMNKNAISEERSKSRTLSNLQRIVAMETA
jgi:hypothetical protein